MQKNLKVILYNLIFFIIFILILELIFGFWFKKNNFGIHMRNERNKNWKTTSSFNDKEYSFFYKRNFYGFRGDEFNPEDVKIIFNGGSTEAWRLGDMASYFPKESVAYRSKWYSHQGSDPMVHGIGIHGQYLFVDRDRQLSISWFSSDNDPISTERLPKVLNIVNQIRNQLS